MPSAVMCNVCVQKGDDILAVLTFQLDWLTPSAAWEGWLPSAAAWIISYFQVHWLNIEENRQRVTRGFFKVTKILEINVREEFFQSLLPFLYKLKRWCIRLCKKLAAFKESEGPLSCLEKPATGPTLNQLNPDDILANCFSKTHLNVILSFIPRIP